MGRLMEGKTALNVGKLAQVRPWHRAMARLVAAGARPGEVAESFGYTPGMISRIMGSPLFQAEVARIECGSELEAVKIREDLLETAKRAAERLDGIVESPLNDELWGARAKLADTCFGVLDRAGYGKKEQPQEHKHLHLHAEVKAMSDEELLKDVLDLTSVEVES